MRSRFVSLCLLFALLLSGCTLLQKTDPPPEKAQEETAPAPTEEPKEPEPEVPQGPINPLTGLETGMTENSASQKPVGVMISNSSNSLPQWGISQADVIFEMIAEGRITRFLALFQDPSSVEALGSVRSARPYFIDMARGFDALYLHFGGSVPAYEKIARERKEGLIAMDGIRDGWEGSLFVRDPSRRKELGLEHSVITSGERIDQALSTLDQDLSRGTDASFFSFSQEHSAKNGASAQRVQVTFSKNHKPYFEYDPQQGVYLRYQYGKPQMDAWYDTQLAFENVFVLRMPLTDVPGSELHLVEVDTTGEGQGFYCSEGRFVPITWKKAGSASPLELLDEKGNPLQVRPGRSFFSVVTQTDDIIIE